MRNCGTAHSHNENEIPTILIGYIGKKTDATDFPNTKWITSSMALWRQLRKLFSKAIMSSTQQKQERNEKKLAVEYF